MCCKTDMRRIEERKVREKVEPLTLVRTTTPKDLAVEQHLAMIRHADTAETARNVVLPAPFTPSSEIICPGSMSSVTSSSAWTRPYDLLTFRSSIFMAACWPASKRLSAYDTLGAAMFRSRLRFTITFLAGMAVTAVSLADSPQPEDVVFPAECDQTEQRFVQILPADFQATQTHDVLIALHGHGSDRWQFVRDSRDECRAARRRRETLHDLRVARLPGRTSWMGPKAEADLVQIIRDLRKRHRIGRVFITGGSMGGTAALTFAVLHPDLVAGVASMNGTANLLEYANFQDAISASFGGAKSAIPDEYKKRSAEYWPERFSMPVGITTGGHALVPPHSVERLAGVLKQLNRQVLLIRRDSTGHQTNYEDGVAILEFVIQQAKRLALRSDAADHSHSLESSLMRIALIGSTGNLAATCSRVCRPPDMTSSHWVTLTSRLRTRPTLRRPLNHCIRNWS